MASIAPGLDGFLMARQMGQQQQNQEMAQAQGLMGILAQVKKQEQEQAYRGALSQAKTPEEQLAIASRFMGPDALGKMIQGGQDRSATRENTRAIALSRLAQTAAQAENTHQYRMSTLTNAADRAAETARHNRVMEGLSSERVGIDGKRLEYDTGYSVPRTPAPAMPRPNMPQPGAMTPAPAGALQGVLNASNFPSVSPEQQAARDADAAAIRGREVTGGGIPTGSIVPGSQAGMQPGALQAILAAQGPNADMNDRRFAGEIRAQPPVAQAAPPATVAPIASQTNSPPASPQMPNFTGSPRQVAAARNKWLADQSKPGAGGSASQAVVDAILAGRMAVPTGFALRSPYWQDVIERVAQKDPTFDATKYGARAAARRTFASGPEARNVTAINTVIGHLGTLDEAATALQNGDIRTLNSIQNRIATELGDPRVQNFDTAKQAVAEETMRVFRQVGASESEARAWGERITSSGSPQQLRGVIKTLGDLLDSRVEAIGRQFDRTVNQDGNPARVDPKNLRVLDRLRGKPQTNARGWKLMTDANGNAAYVGPNNEIEEVQ